MSFATLITAAVIPWGATNATASPILITVTALIFLASISRIRLPRAAIALAFLVLGTNGFDYLTNYQYDEWQFIRSGIPFLLCPFALFAGRSLAIRASTSGLIDSSFAALTLAAAAHIAMYFGGLINFNAIIASESRIFTFPYLCFFPLIAYFGARRRHVLMLLCIGICAASGSKSAIAGASVLALLTLFFFAKGRQDPLAYFLAASATALAGAFIWDIYGERFQIFFQDGDTTRVRMINDAIGALTADTMTLIFGANFGRPVLLGFYDLASFNADQVRLFENYRFDVDNGFVMAALKVGLLGVALLLATYIAIFRSLFGRVLLMATLAPQLASSGGILFTADGAFAHLVLGYVGLALAKPHAPATASPVRPASFARQVSRLRPHDA